MVDSEVYQLVELQLLKGYLKQYFIFATIICINDDANENMCVASQIKLIGSYFLFPVCMIKHVLTETEAAQGEQGAGSQADGGG